MKRLSSVRNCSLEYCTTIARFVNALLLVSASARLPGTNGQIKASSYHKSLKFKAGNTPFSSNH